MSNIQSSFDNLSDEEFLNVRNAILRATEGMTDEKNVDVHRVLNTRRVAVRISDLQIDTIEKLNGLLRILGPNAAVESDEREEIRKRAA